MSRLTVGSIEGLTENSDVISVPTGHTLNAVDGLQIGGVAQGVRTSWTPTWGNLTVGNGTETGYYTVFNGLMFIDYRLVWGSTTSMSANPNFNLPSGWQQAAAGYNVVGQLIMRDTGTDEFFGFIKGNGVGTTNCLLKTSKVGATYGQTDVMNGTIPFTWTTSDELMFTALFPVTAV